MTANVWTRGLRTVAIYFVATAHETWVASEFADTPTRSPLIIYGGAECYARQGCEVKGWRPFALMLSRIPTQKLNCLPSKSEIHKSVKQVNP